jgi:Ecdysteroid kinase-like family
MQAPHFLFKYGDDNATPLACRIIDFQLARYGSPVLDISFLIYSCTQ